MSRVSGSGSSPPWDGIVEQAERDHCAWLETLEARIAEAGIEAVVQRYREGEVNSNELLHSLMIARKFPHEFVELAGELILSLEGSSTGREFLKRSGSENAVPALRRLLEAPDTKDVYWALDALQGIRCEASLEAVRSFKNQLEPVDPDERWAFDFLEGQRQATLDALEGNEKANEERLADEISDAIRERGAASVVGQTLEDKYPVDQVFIALRELGEFPENGIALAMKLGTDAKLESNQRRSPIHFLCEYRGDDAEALLIEALEAQLDIHFSGGDAWGEGCRLMEAIGRVGSEAAIEQLESIDLARSGAANASTVDLEDDRQNAMARLTERWSASSGSASAAEAKAKTTTNSTG